MFVVQRSFVLLLALTLLGGVTTAEAKKNSAQSYLQVGPFTLGQTVSEFRSAARSHGFTKPRRQAPEDRDIMGLGVMMVQLYSVESKDLEPTVGELWGAIGYFLSGRLVYLSLDYVYEDTTRAAHWFEHHHAPVQVRKKLQDTSWLYEGVMFHVDRFGRRLYAVNWAGLRNSDRILVGADGAVRVCNRYFRAIRAQKALASVDLIRRRIIKYIAQSATGTRDERQCGTLASVDLTPTPTACDAPDKRFAVNHDAWKTPTWQALGIRSKDLSRFYSFSIDAAGSSRQTRIVLQARGDLDCNDSVATIRVTLRADLRSDRYECNLDDGRWEIINPHE
jgi:hypothetical protein